MQRVPFMLVAGDREKAASSVSVRQRDGKDLGVMSVDDLITHLQQLNSTKAQEI